MVLAGLVARRGRPARCGSRGPAPSRWLASRLVRSATSAHVRRRSRNTRHSASGRRAAIASSTVLTSSSATAPDPRSWRRTLRGPARRTRIRAAADASSVRAMSNDGIVFGAFMPQGWKMELASIDGAAAKWAKAVEIAQLAEELGYDSIWVYDHFHNVPRPAHEAVFECWTTIAAISQLTSRIRLGQMVGCNSYRNPGLLAKITSTIDVISGGRLDWGIGAGWYENEYRGYGFEFPTPKDRIGMLRETVEIVKSMWTQPETTYNGEYYELSRANCDPKPLQDPHPPVWIGGGGEQLTLRVVARHADCSNFGGSPEQWAHKREVLHGPLRRRRPRPGGDPQDVVAGGVHPRAPRPRSRPPGSRSLWGEPVDTLAGRQPRRHARAGRREDPDVRRPRLPRLHPVVHRLPRHRDAGALRHRGHPQLPLIRATPSGRRTPTVTRTGGRAPRRRTTAWPRPRPRRRTPSSSGCRRRRRSTSSSLAPRRSFEPTGTGAGKRILSAP